MEIFERSTAFLVEKIWAGTTLALWKKEKNLSSVGESWEISRLKEGPSHCPSGRLDTLLTQEELPYLIKYIDAGSDLSIQVHPDDEYALAVEGMLGKAECWIVLAAKKGSGIYLGFKENVGESDFTRSLEKGDDITHLLNFYPVSRGTFATIPPGAIHSIGGGVLLAEIQQSSPLTYRIWDQGRRDYSGNLRSLHIDKAMAVLNFDPLSNRRAFFHIRNHVFFEKHCRLTSCDDFTVDSFCLSRGESLSHSFDSCYRYRAILLFEGTIVLESGDAEEKMDYHQTILINKEVQWVKIRCLKDSVFIVVS